MRRYFRLAWRFFSLCAAREMQYRAHFCGTLLSSLSEIALFLVFIETVLSHVDTIGTWDRPRMYVLYGTFVLVEALAQFMVSPNMEALSESVRRGELDYIFTKPVDAQVFISLRQYHLPSLGGVVSGALIVAYGCRQLAVWPGWWAVLGYACSICCALAIIYSLWLLSVVWVFKAIRIDNLPVLFIPILQFARYPITAYPRALQATLRFAIPLVFVATVPAEVLLSLSAWPAVVGAAGTAVLALGVARLGWLAASRLYASASS